MARPLFKRIILSSTFLVLSSCAGSPMMTRSQFNEIELGTTATEVVKQYGDPYQIRKLKDGSQEYEYIEKIMMGEQTVEENKYFLIIKNGQVVSKRYNQEIPPAYDEIYDEDPNNDPN